MVEMEFQGARYLELLSSDRSCAGITENEKKDREI